MGIIDTIIKIYELPKEELVDRYHDLRMRYAESINSVDRFDILMESNIVAMRLVEIHKNEPVMANNSEPVWIDDDNYWFDEFGLRTWTRVDCDGTTYSAQRSYYWVDRIIIMDNTRRIIDDIPFSEFVASPKYGLWTPNKPTKE